MKPKRAKTNRPEGSVPAIILTFPKGSSVISKQEKGYGPPKGGWSPNGGAFHPGDGEEIQYVMPYRQIFIDLYEQATGLAKLGRPQMLERLLDRVSRGEAALLDREAGGRTTSLLFKETYRQMKPYYEKVYAALLAENPKKHISLKMLEQRAEAMTRAGAFSTEECGTNLSTRMIRKFLREFKQAR